MNRSTTTAGFTLLEVVASMLLLAVGFASVMGMSRLGMRWSGEAMSAATGMVTALSVVADARPGGRSADPGDADLDGWELESGSLTIPTAGAYEFVTAGFINGYYVRRVESSIATDVFDGHGRHADVVVDVFWGIEGDHVIGLRRRILRRY